MTANAISEIMEQSVFTRESASALVFSDIFQDNVPITVWRRDESHRSGDYVETLRQRDQRCELIQTVSPDDVSGILDAKIPDGPGRAELITDVSLLVDMFTCLFGLNQAGLRLTKLTTRMCPRFHTDRVPCRLLCTYGPGPGTQWLPNHHADRRYLGGAGSHLADADKAVAPDSETIRSIDPGDPALLKGEAWPGNDGRGLIHRSPMVSHDQIRLLLSLDFV